MTKSILEGILENDHRILSRFISEIEYNGSVSEDLLINMHQYTHEALRIGITGPPGAGKSTLVDQLIKSFREDGKSIGVVAVDPTSPFSGGALLGDRVRMNSFMWDENVFIRSMGTHGDLGGLAKKAQDVGDVLAASGKDIVIYETVGVGQGEHDVAKAVDITVVVLVPESGDEIQLMKAGLIEIADFFVINKSDREGAGRLATVLRNLLHTYTKEDFVEPPVMNTVASKGEGVIEFKRELMNHLAVLEEKGIHQKKLIQRHRDRVRTLIQERLLSEFWTSERMKILEAQTESLDSIKSSPYEITHSLLAVNSNG